MTETRDIYEISRLLAEKGRKRMAHMMMSLSDEIAAIRPDNEEMAEIMMLLAECMLTHGVAYATDTALYIDSAGSDVIKRIAEWVAKKGVAEIVESNDYYIVLRYPPKR